MSELQPLVAGSGRALWAALLFACLAPTPVAAATPVGDPGRAPLAARPVPVAGPPVVLGSWLDSVSGVFEGALQGNRARVIQFATVIMILALFVIWWRK